MLQLGTALGLKLDISKYKLQINFGCLLAKYYIWICKLKTFPPILFRLYETYETYETYLRNGKKVQKFQMGAS